MNLLSVIQKAFPEKQSKPTRLKLVSSQVNPQTREEIIYRKNGYSIDKIIEIDLATGSRLKTTHYDYFNDKKIRSIDEYDKNTGLKIRTINYVLYKSIDEYDMRTGKKFRTINFNIKDDTKISSIQEYDLETGKIVTISIYKRDGKNVSIIKKIDPNTGKVTNWINHDSCKLPEIKPDESKPNEIKAPKIVTFNNNSLKMLPRQNYSQFKSNMSEEKKNDIAKLIDNLYSDNVNFESLKK